MRPKNPRFRYFYLAALVFGGILTHLMSEFAGMGSDADEVLFSPRHIYLGAAALACAALALRELITLRAHSNGPRDFKRIIVLNLDALPLKGWRFFVGAAVAQFGIGILSAVGEGCFFCGHDVVAALIGGLATAILLAFTARIVARRLPSIATALAYFLRPAGITLTPRWTPLPSAALDFDRFYWFSSLFNRPPPQLQF